MTVNVTTNVGALEQLHVICTRESTHVVDLGDPGQEELNCSRGEVVLVVASQCGVVRGVDLVEIQVRGRRTGSFARFLVGVCVDCFDEAVDVGIWNQTLERTVQLVRTDVDDADSIVRVQYGHSIIGTHIDPVLKSIDAA